jgi:signal peptidase I
MNMRVETNGSGEQHSGSIDEVVDPLADASVSSLAPDAQALSAEPARTFRSRGGPDYRLRGLDLGTEVVPARATHRDRPRNRRRRRFVVKLVLILVVAAVGASLLRASVVQPFSVPSAAMMPTLHAGDRILVVKSSRLAGAVRSGNIVVFHRPSYFPCTTGRAKAADLVQRVIGVPGDTIWSVGNKIFIDGRQLRERGWYDTAFGQVGSAPIHRTTISSGRYFVMGDNRSDSCDSRTFGTVPRSSIVGKVFAIVVRDRHLYVHFF